MKALLPLFFVAALPSCGQDRPSAPSADQSDQLNEAEELLNEVADEESAGPN